ncbi:hypothetical protein D3C73_1477410 [compost metagenome]
MCLTGQAATCAAPSDVATVSIFGNLTGCPAATAAANDAAPSVSQATMRQSVCR